MSRTPVTVLALVAVSLAGCASPAPTPGAPTPLPPDVEWDYLVAGGRVVDGTGNPWRWADVAVAGDRIVRVAPTGTLDPARAREFIDARGLVVAPGFVDLNGQSDEALLEDGRAVNKLFMGVTTEIMGESNTPAPWQAYNEGPPAWSDTTAVRRSAEWDRFGGWLEEIEAGGVALNVASFIGGTTVRRYAMGFREGPPSRAELDTMRAVTARAMEDGALGVASALIYPPGAFAGTDELIEISRVVASYGGVYISHIRSESYGLLGAIDEAIDIGRRASVPIEIYHLKAAGRENWHLLDDAIRRIDEARAEGVDIQAALYPYTAASTSLQACLPPWASADDRLRRTLRDPASRARIVAEMTTGPADAYENWCRLAGPEGSMITSVSDRNRELVGRTLSEVATRRGRPWAEVAIDLLLEEGNAGMVYFAMSEENVRETLRQPWIKVGSDSGAHDPELATGATHPRSYGTYPRILGKYVRDEGVLPLEDAVRKMTSAVTDRVGLKGRGLVREGYFADLVLFDPESIGEVTTYTDPHRLSRGIVHLLVNGVPVMRGGALTDARPGRFLRGPGALQGPETRGVGR
ncbi:MAG: D-aminoacylase [Longimicrobiales bacterium]|nr:D-aminoacylase [Longimicrobiales bacterium]